jgi:hypothetical protein
VLHHRDPAVAGAALVAGLALLDVLEVDLLELLGFGVDRRPGEGEVEARFAGRRIAVAHQLQVQLWRQVLSLVLTISCFTPMR